LGEDLVEPATRAQRVEVRLAGGLSAEVAGTAREPRVHLRVLMIDARVLRWRLVAPHGCQDAEVDPARVEINQRRFGLGGPGPDWITGI
jgi:hypothetical protein